MKRNKSPAPPKKSGYVLGIAVGLACVSLICLLIYWRSVPKLQATEAALKTVDALFTAINAHDLKRIEACRVQLERYKSKGELGPSAMVELAGCCQQAESGAWEPAARRLYRLIENQ